METSAKLVGANGESLTISLVDIEAVQPGSSGPGSLLLRVCFEFDAFSSAVDAWFEAGEWKQFLLGIARVEGDRDGVVCLRSMSPGEVEVTLAVRKGGREAMLDGLIGLRAGRRSIGLSFSKVEVDVGLLNGFLHDVRRLAT